MRGEAKTARDARDETRDRLLALGKRREELHAEQARVRAEFIEAIPEAKAAGWPMATVARFAGMTRKAVYDALNEAQQESPGDAETSRGQTAQEDLTMSSSSNPSPPPTAEPDDVLALRAYLAERLRAEAEHGRHDSPTAFHDAAAELEDRGVEDERLIRLTAAWTRPGADGIAGFYLGAAAAKWVHRFDADMTLDALLDLLIADETSQQAAELDDDLRREGGEL